MNLALMGQISLVSFVSHGLWSIKREQLMVHQINFYLGPDLPLDLLTTYRTPASICRKRIWKAQFRCHLLPESRY